MALPFHSPPTFNPVVYNNSSPNSQTNTKDMSSQCAQNQDEAATPEFEKKEWHGFKTENSPPVIKELVRFEEELYKMARNIKFRKICNTEFQNMINQTIKIIKNSKEIIVPADKSPNLYKVPVSTYKKMRHSVVTKDYKACSQNEVSKVNLNTLHLIKTYEPDLESRVEVFTHSEAFMTLKDHKMNFVSKMAVRLLNPAKPQLGKITKVKLQRINSEIRSIEKLNQLQSTNGAIKWFNGLKHKNQRHFLISDVLSFYPSITEKILKNSFSWARYLIRIPEADELLVFMARNSLLFVDSKPWVKKENPSFDVTMGSFDGAEVAEFVGLFLLNELTSIMSQADFALYRDDGICAIRGTKRSVDDTQKKIEKTFNIIGLQVEMPTMGPTKSVDFFYLNLNLTTV